MAGPRAFLYLLLSAFLGGGLHPAAGHFIAEHYVFVEARTRQSAPVRPQVRPPVRPARCCRRRRRRSPPRAAGPGDVLVLRAVEHAHLQRRARRGKTFPRAHRAPRPSRHRGARGSVERLPARHPPRSRCAVGYHNEHHDFPRIPGSRLAAVRAAAPEFYVHLSNHDSYCYVIYKYITDPRMGPFMRRGPALRPASPRRARLGRLRRLVRSLSPPCRPAVWPG